MTYHCPAFAPADELERLLFHMPTIAEKSENQWPRSFAQSIVRQSRRRGWKPSTKQLSMMRRLVSDLFVHGYEGGDTDVLE
ncbi:MAG: hypothetical protein ACU0CC_04865 [Sagittula sp.]|uniref:hypothetical protein n=1 Tax=Sagittula sp. TaxID=2038081 RepID=UPI004059012B